MARISKIQIRRDTAANWSSVNPTLADGEVGLDTSNNLIKYGNGASTWNDLLPFTNQNVLAISDLATGGSITTAANINIYTAFNVNQTTAGQTLTLPTPTQNAVNKSVFVINSGSASFTVYGTTLTTDTGTQLYFRASTQTWIPVSGSGGGGSTTSISNGTSNVNIPSANGNVLISSAGTANVVVVTSTGANIAGTANITGNTAIGGNLAITGKSNLNAVGNVTITGGTTGQVLTTNGSGTLTWSTVSAGSLANGTSNISIPTVNGNVLISSAGTANVLVVTGTGANIAGTANITGNLIAGNISATTLTGNLANLVNGTSNIRVIANGNVVISSGNFANIVVVKTNGVNVNGSLTVSGQTSLGPASNVFISGGGNGQVLSADGIGGTRWADLSSVGGIPSWNLPTVNAYISATTTAPTIGTTTRNQMGWRLIGPKELQIQMIFDTTGAGANSGNGDYLFTLPNGYSLDTNVQSQAFYQLGVGANDNNFPRYAVPGGSGWFYFNNNTTNWQCQPVMYDNTRFRILIFASGVGVKCWSSGWYGMNFPTSVSLNFSVQIF